MPGATEVSGQPIVGHILMEKCSLFAMIQLPGHCKPQTAEVNMKNSKNVQLCDNPKPFLVCVDTSVAGNNGLGMS